MNITMTIIICTRRGFRLRNGKAQEKRILFPAVLMPKTAMDENYFLSGPENQIWMSGQIFGMKAVTITHAVNEPAHSKFDLRVRSMNP